MIKAWCDLFNLTSQSFSIVKDSTLISTISLVVLSASATALYLCSKISPKNFSNIREKDINFICEYDLDNR